MTPGAGVLVLGCGHSSHTVKMHYALFLVKSSSLFLGIDQTNKYVVMMTMEGSNKIVNFITPGEGVPLQRRGHISHIVKMHYFFKNLLLNSQA